jgi:uncharacterized membrane protein YdjX (TVP38/TMEM64 family)
MELLHKHVARCIFYILNTMKIKYYLTICNNHSFPRVICYYYIGNRKSIILCSIVFVRLMIKATEFLNIKEKTYFHVR